MIEISAAVQVDDLVETKSSDLKKDLELRFQKALLSELKHNMPGKFEYVAADTSVAGLEKQMCAIYQSGTVKKDCGLVKIFITIEAVLVSGQ